MGRALEEPYRVTRMHERCFAMTLANRHFLLQVPHAMLFACGDLNVKPGTGRGLKSIRRRIAKTMADAAISLCHSRGRFDGLVTDSDSVTRSFSRELFAQHAVIVEFVGLLRWLDEHTEQSGMWSDEAIQWAWLVVDGIESRANLVNNRQAQMLTLASCAEISPSAVFRTLDFIIACKVLFGITSEYDALLQRILEGCSEDRALRVEIQTGHYRRISELPQRAEA